MKIWKKILLLILWTVLIWLGAAIGEGWQWMNFISYNLSLLFAWWLFFKR